MIKFHFLNVGHGDTTIIDLPDNKLMVVDFNRSNDFDEETSKELAEAYNINLHDIKKSLNKYKYLSKYYNITLDDPLEYLLENYNDNSIFRYIQSHPDIDHLCGFKALTDNFIIRNFWDTDHNNIIKVDFNNKSDEADWDHYLNYRKKRLIFYRSEKDLSSNQKYPYKIFVFHPTEEALHEGDSKENPQPNYFCYLILIDYCGFKTVLGSDVTEEYWEDLWYWLNSKPLVKEIFKKINILKASHHGRKSGRCGWEENGNYNRDFLNWMDPDYVIISVGKKPENCDATSWYRIRPNNSTREVLTTRWYGTIWISYDGTIPLDKSRITVETRYDRKDDFSKTEELNMPFKDYDYEFQIGAKRGLNKNGPFQEEYKTRGRWLNKNLWLKFYIKKSNIPDPYEVKWRVINTGEEARAKNDLRGKIEIGNSSTKTKVEHTLYKGTHIMDTYAIKSGECVAKDRFFVNIK